MVYKKGKRGMTMNIEEILHDYASAVSGIVGTIVGTLFTSAWQYFSRKYFGKLQFFFYNDRVGLNGCKNQSKMEINTIDDAAEGQFTFYADIYSSKEIPIGLRNIKLRVGINGTECQLKGTDKIPGDPQNIYILNIPPGQFLKYIFIAHFTKEQLIQIFKENYKLYFVAKTQDDKEIIEEIYIGESREKYLY